MTYNIIIINYQDKNLKNFFYWNKWIWILCLRSYVRIAKNLPVCYRFNIIGFILLLFLW